MAAWKIENLRYTNNSDKIVKHVLWRCFDSKEAAGELHTADQYGSVTLDEIAADTAWFIPYADLSESKCLEWVHAKLDKDEFETNIAEAIAASENPPVKSGKPW